MVFERIVGTILQYVPTYLLCMMLFTTLYLVTYLAIMRLIVESFQS